MVSVFKVGIRRLIMRGYHTSAMCRCVHEQVRLCSQWYDYPGIFDENGIQDQMAYAPEDREIRVNAKVNFITLDVVDEPTFEKNKVCGNNKNYSENKNE